MKGTKKLLSLLLSLALAVSLAAPALAAEENAGDVVVLYTNDVHTYIDNNVGEGNENGLTYSKVAGYRDTCMRMLRARLVELKMQEHAEKISDLKGVQMKIEWGSQIRSYVFMPYQLVKDTRTGYETSNVSAVMDGDLDGFINAYLTAEATGNWATK